MTARPAYLRQAADRAFDRSCRLLDRSNELLRLGQLEGSDFLRHRSDQLLAAGERWDEISCLLNLRAAELEADAFRVSALFGVVSPYPQTNRGAA